MCLTLIVLILVSHFIADFICQSDRIAKGKSKSLETLTQHAVIYSIVFIGILVSVDGIFHLTNLSFDKWVTTYVFVVYTHWITDFFTSKINSLLWEKKLTHWFFVGIGADQLIHYITLFGWFNHYIK